MQEIVLAPLTHEDLEQLIADALHCEPDRASPLAQLIHDKTAGNPFFAIQFVASLAEEGLLAFDHGEGRWAWDLNRINAKDYTDSVVDLLVGKFLCKGENFLLSTTFNGSVKFSSLIRKQPIENRFVYLNLTIMSFSPTIINCH